MKNEILPLHKNVNSGGKGTTTKDTFTDKE